MVADECHKDLFNYRFNKKNLSFRYRVLSKELLDIQATIECGFNLKRVRDMIGTYNQMHRTDTYSQHSSIFWPVCLNGWELVYELSGCGFEFRYHLNFRYRACFEQGVPRQSGNYNVWIHSYNQIHRRDKYSQYSSIIRPVWLNGWVYELSGCGFESPCSDLNKKGIWKWYLTNSSFLFQKTIFDTKTKS